jgi:hypothetical protein
MAQFPIHAHIDNHTVPGDSMDAIIASQTTRDQLQQLGEMGWFSAFGALSFFLQPFMRVVSRPGYRVILVFSV